VELNLLKLLRQAEKLLSGKRSKRRKALRQILVKHLLPLLKEKDLKKALEGKLNPIAGIRDNWVYPFWRNMDGAAQRIFRGIVRHNWDIITELLTNYDTIKEIFLEARPSLKKYVDHPNFKPLVEAVAAYTGAVLTVACWDCFCAICGRKVTPIDFIYFPNAHDPSGNPLPYAYRFTHHRCYADLIRRSGVLEKVRT